MPISRAIFLSACLLLATAARAQEDDPPPPAAVSDVLYKGVVGKVLDAVPMDPEERVTLQRTGAVVSGTLTGRSLSAWSGLTHPILWVAGFAWGLVSASNIKAEPPAAKPVTTPLVVSPELLGITPIQVAALTAPPAEAQGNE